MPLAVLDDVGDVEADLDLETVPPEVMEFARDKLGETPETKLRTLDELREMIYQRGDVTPLSMDDGYLLRFLRARSFKVEATHRLLVNYASFRESNPHFYANVNPLDLSFIGDADVVSVMPYREQRGRRIMIYKLGKWNPNDYAMDEIFKASLAILELGVLEPRTQILGGVVIFDLEGLSLHHYWHFTPAVVNVVVQMIMTSLPMKTTAIHIIHEGFVFDMIFKMFKPLLGRRYRDMVFFHGSRIESLHEHISPKYLPEVYGGIRPNYGYKDWFDTLKVNDKIVQEMLALGYSQ